MLMIFSASLVIVNFVNHKQLLFLGRLSAFSLGALQSTSKISKLRVCTKLSVCTKDSARLPVQWTSTHYT